MQSGHVASSLNFHAVVNGALVFAVGPIFYTGKWITLFTETVYAFNLLFQQIELNLQEYQVHHSKERKILVWKQH